MSNPGDLPQHLQDRRSKVVCRPHHVDNNATTSSFSTFKALGIDDSYSFAAFQDQAQVRILSSTADRLQFDLIGVDAPFANALRRVMLSEVPSVAIETVIFNNNTSIIQDEVLAHRLGLIPLNVDADLFHFPGLKLTRLSDTTNSASVAAKSAADEAADSTAESAGDDSNINNTNTSSTNNTTNNTANTSSSSSISGGDSSSSSTPDELEQLRFKLQVRCRRRPGVPEDAPDTERYENAHVFSSALEWVPFGNQAQRFAHRPVAPVQPDILLAKLRPGQCIDLECIAVKGYGADHAKFSPVCTASYRFLPEISFKQPVLNEEAVQLKKLCPMNVFDIEDIAGQRAAIAARPRNCTMCRECIRDAGWDQKIELARRKRHFVFSVESVGAISPADIVRRAFRILMENKCEQQIRNVKYLMEAMGGGGGKGSL